MTRTGYALMTFLLLQLAGCGRSGQEAAVEPWPDRIELVIADSLGEGTGEDRMPIGAIGDLCFGREGRIMVMDQVEGDVKVFSRTGEFITSFGGRGDGPGEVSVPLAVAALEDGRVLLLDPGENSYEVFDGDDYSHIGKVSLWSSNPPQDPWGLDGGHYLGLKFQLDTSGGEMTGINTLGRFHIGSGDPEVVYYREEFRVDMENLGEMVKMMLMGVTFAGDRNGRVFYSPMSTGEYRVISLDSTGTRLFSISADVPRHARSSDEMEWEKTFMEQWISRMGGMGGMPLEWEPEPYRWMISGLGVDGDGRLWVLRGTEDPPVFDVFDAEGCHSFSAVFPRKGLNWKFHVSGEGMLAWNGDPETGVQRVYVVETP